MSKRPLNGMVPDSTLPFGSHAIAEISSDATYAQTRSKPLSESKTERQAESIASIIRLSNGFSYSDVSVWKARPSSRNPM